MGFLKRENLPPIDGCFKSSPTEWGLVCQGESSPKKHCESWMSQVKFRKMVGKCGWGSTPYFYKSFENKIPSEHPKISLNMFETPKRNKCIFNPTTKHKIWRVRCLKLGNPIHRIRIPPGLRRLWDQRLMFCCQRTPVWKGTSTWKPVGVFCWKNVFKVCPKSYNWMSCLVWIMISKWSGYWLLDHVVDTQTCWVFHIKTDSFCITESMVEDSFSSSARLVPLIFFRISLWLFTQGLHSQNMTCFFNGRSTRWWWKKKWIPIHSPKWNISVRKIPGSHLIGTEINQKPGMSSKKWCRN